MNDLINLLIYTVDDIKMAIYLHSTKQAIRMVEITPLPYSSDVLLGLINYYGEIVPIVNMRKVLNRPQKEKDLNDQIIITRSEKRTLGLWVDRVIGLFEYKEKDIIEAEKYLNQNESIDNILIGSIRLSDGLLLIHNIETLISKKEEELLLQSIAQSKV
ncbi:MAG TPA: chemotaxis protein CheW [Nitrospirae bacterium]|nr:chemotaxis protein CheW [Nitrospirota bacterium]